MGEAAEEKKVLQNRKAEEEVNVLICKERKVDKLIGEALRLEKAIADYIDGGKEENFVKLKNEKAVNEETMGELKEARSNVERNLAKIKDEISNQDGRRRTFEDNLRLRDYQIEEKKHRK